MLLHDLFLDFCITRHCGIWNGNFVFWCCILMTRIIFFIHFVHDAFVNLSFEQIHKLKLALIYKPFHWHFYIHTWNVDIVKAQQSLFWYKTANHKTKLKLNLVVYIFVPFWDIRHAKFKAKQFLFQTEQKSKHVNALNWSFVHIVLWGDETTIH